MAGHSLATPPGADELEVSLFGPGFGEAVVAHVGEGDWIVVDSCVAPKRSDPETLRYLEQLGVDVREQVQLVVATHWDDDHIRGLAQVIRRARQARFALSAAYTSHDFLSILRAFEPGSMRRRSGVREFWEIYDFLRRNRRRPRHASVDRLLWQRTSDIPCRVWALSPSDSDQAASIDDFREAFLEAQANGTREFFSTVKPNASSVVLWVAVGNLQLLLGADLECSSDNQRGWTAVVASDAWDTEADLVKIPHHGSSGAHHPEMWNQMLVSDPVALASPFIRGRHRIPTSAERNDIRARTTRAFLTRDPERLEPGLLPGSIQTFRESTRSFEVVETSVGHVRARARLDGSSGWTVDLFGSAVPL